MSDMMQINIIPKPQQVVMPAIAGTFTITPSTVIVANEATVNSADFLNNYLNEIYGFSLKISDKLSSANAINLNIATPIRTTIEGAYDMEVTGNGVNIRGQNEAGAFH